MTELSPRLRLAEWRSALPDIWRAVDTVRQSYRPDRSDWPSVVFLPLERAGEATMAAIHASGSRRPNGPAELAPAACTTQCLAAWRMTQGVYRIDPTLYAALIDTPITGDIPADVLLYLPEWCVYVETPGMTAPASGGATLPVLGLWYWLDAAPGRPMILSIGIDTGRRPPLTVTHVPLIGSLDASIEETIREWRDAYSRGNAGREPPEGFAAAARAWLPPALSLILYLCSTAAEIAGDGQPGNPQPIVTRRRGARLYAAEGVRLWDVGMRLGAALRAAQARQEASEAAAGSHVRPHVRRAHWHTYLTGPRKGVDPQARARSLRWLPPIPIGVEDYDALPAVVHRLG